MDLKVKLKCIDCGGEIPLSECDEQADLAKCPHCGTVFSLKRLFSRCAAEAQLLATKRRALFVTLGNAGEGNRMLVRPKGNFDLIIMIICILAATLGSILWLHLHEMALIYVFGSIVATSLVLSITAMCKIEIVIKGGIFRWRRYYFRPGAWKEFLCSAKTEFDPGWSRFNDGNFVRQIIVRNAGAEPIRIAMGSEWYIALPAIMFMAYSLPLDRALLTTPCPETEQDALERRIKAASENSSTGWLRLLKLLLPLIVFLSIDSGAQLCFGTPKHKREHAKAVVTALMNGEDWEQVADSPPWCIGFEYRRQLNRIKQELKACEELRNRLVAAVAAKDESALSAVDSEMKSRYEDGNKNTECPSFLSQLIYPLLGMKINQVILDCHENP